MSSDGHTKAIADSELLVLSAGESPEWDRISSYLKRNGVTVFRASASRDAFRIIRNERVNIILADYGTVGKNVPAFLRKIKALKPHIEMILLTEKISLANATDALRAGVYDIYELPVSPKMITTVMGKALEKQLLFIENRELQRKVQERFNFGKLVGRSKAMQHVVEIVGSVATKNVNILLTGETGTGKEMIANAIHYNSGRASKPFIKVNCAAFNEGVLESELFGHEKGSFTGALTKRIGRFELAHEGTIFLDEIGDVSLSTQIKLLRVLQESEFERVGGNETLKVDVRIIAATNHDIERLIREGKFREDLYYRLNIVRIDMPPLRDRKDDIPLLVSYFINQLNSEKGYGIKGITKESMQVLLNYRWPGNVRELENAIESAMALSQRDIIEAKYLPAFLLLSPAQHSDFYQIPRNLTLDEIEQEVIRLTLERTGGNKTRAAKLLNIGLRTIQRKTQERE